MVYFPKSVSRKQWILNNNILGIQNQSGITIILKDKTKLNVIIRGDHISLWDLLKFWISKKLSEFKTQTISLHQGDSPLLLSPPIKFSIPLLPRLIIYYLLSVSLCQYRQIWIYSLSIVFVTQKLVYYICSCIASLLYIICMSICIHIDVWKTL